MNYYAFSGLAIGLVATICGATAFINNIRSWKNQLFVIYCLSVALWGYFYWSWQLADTEREAIIQLRLLSGSVIWTPVLHYHVILSLFNIFSATQRNILKISYIISGIFFVSNFTDSFIESVEPKLLFRFWPNPGLFFHLYVGLFTFLVIAALIHLFFHWKKSKPQIKKEVGIIALATLCAYGAGSLNNLLWYNIPVPPFLNILIPVSLCVITFYFLKLQYLEVQNVFKKLSLIFFIYACLMALAFSAAIPLAGQWARQNQADPVLIVMVFGGFIGIILSMGPFIYATLVKNSFWLKTQFSTGLTHELKSPLGNIQSALDILETNPNKGKEYLTIIRGNATRLESTIRDLLYLSQIQNLHVVLEKSEVNLSQLINEVIDSYKPEISLKKLTVIRNGPENLMVQCDRDKIKQVFSNLLSNAIKFSDHGNINIDYQKSGKNILCSVQDQGTGIHPKNLDKIFNRFTQGAKTSKGAGIGLSIAKGWVEAHGGKIWAESPGENQGCTITFTLPA